MANYVVKHKCSWGNAGDVVKVDGELTARQKLMLEAPKTAVVDAGDIEELAVVKAENEKLKAELESLKTAPQLDLEAATPKTAAKK